MNYIKKLKAINSNRNNRKDLAFASPGCTTYRKKLRKFNNWILSQINTHLRK